MLEAIASEEPGFEVEVSSGGLFIDIARECRARRDDADIWLLCGRDAAERIVAARAKAPPHKRSQSVKRREKAKEAESPQRGGIRRTSG